MTGISADTTAVDLLQAAAETLHRRRLEEVAELEVLAAWADVHSADSPGSGPLIHPGGQGTPGVHDHAMGEIALARHTGVMATINATADVLDLRHRLPSIWAKTQHAVVDVWVVRKIARLTRHLPHTAVALVDTAITPILEREGTGRILDITAAKIIEADPDLHTQRVETEKKRRYVNLGQTDEHGLRTLIARLEAGDATYIEATVTRVADILKTRHDNHTPDELRAKALGYLARPAELLALLTANTDPHGNLDPHLPHDPWNPTPPTAPEPTGPDEDEDADQPPLNKAIAFPADLLDRLTEVDWAVLKPKHTLYVHLHETALHGTPGVARIESLGAMTLAQLHGLLAGATVTVKPVIDLHDKIRATAYEHPEALKERIHLTTGGDYWPWANSTNRRLDYDHVHPYQPDQPDQPAGPGRTDGQTGTDNAGPLGRRHHRYKTHAGYRATQTGPGEYVWTTPHHQAFLVNHTGSQQIDPQVAEALINRPRWHEQTPRPPAHAPPPDNAPPDPLNPFNPFNHAA
ncbi:DUF222 domain-containing protein [Nocardioides alcanivorans]|uniref:DUF222 domain-containing protein n=1 Tax=Nocardioides alcanivorans TaxID=2897352 RepID=UPI001F46DE36|nr:DUF222 domain-containing protein [Nocardioides alcanivorans]